MENTDQYYNDLPFTVDKKSWQEDNLRLRSPGKFSSYDLHQGNKPRGIRKPVERFIDRVNVDFLPGATAPSRKRKRGRRSANMQRFVEPANRFIQDLCWELGIEDGVQALRILRCVLHSVRDRLTPDDAVQFSAGLPLIVKGIFFDQYDISRTPVLIRDAEEFIYFVRDKDRFGAVEDFRSPTDVVICLQAVFNVLEHHLDHGQVQHIRNQLPQEIRQLLNTFIEDNYKQEQHS